MIQLQSDCSKIPVIVILGPTASSKSETAFNLAKECDAEIISVDSAQIYRGMDIGTAKISQQNRDIVPHFMIDIKEPTQMYSVHQFAQQATAYMHDIHRRSKRIFVVGGSGLYIRALMDGLFCGPSRSDELRQLFCEQAEQKGNEWLHQQLYGVDPKAAAQIHPNNRKRVIRALEVFHLTGLPITQLWEKQKELELASPFRFYLIGLTRPKLELNQHINKRCLQMVEDGLIDEVETLIEQGCQPQHLSMQAIGYRHFMQYLLSDANLDKTIIQFKKDSRLLAKKQRVFFSGMNVIQWFHPDEYRIIRQGILDLLK